MSTQWLIDLGLGLARSGGWEEPVMQDPEIREVVKEVVRTVTAPPEIREVVREVEVVKEVKLPPEIREIEVVKEVIREVEVIKEVHLPAPPPEIREVIKEVRLPAPPPVRVPCHQIPEHILNLARVSVADQRTRWPDAEGETKRAAVYRTLVNRFPKDSKRMISLAIEEALCLES